MEPICTVKASVDSSFSELSSAIFSVSVLLARPEIFSIYWRPLEVGHRYSITFNLAGVRLLIKGGSYSKAVCIYFGACGGPDRIPLHRSGGILL